MLEVTKNKILVVAAHLDDEVLGCGAAVRSLVSPTKATSTELYEEGMELGARLLRMFVPCINDGTAPAIPQDISSRTTYGKVKWADWPAEKMNRAKTYPYD